MKKSRLFVIISSLGIALLLTAAVVSSCSEDFLNDLLNKVEGFSMKSRIVGIWRLTSTNAGGTVSTPATTGIETLYTFDSDGSGSVKTYSYGSLGSDATIKSFSWDVDSNDYIYIDNVKSYSIKSVASDKSKMVLTKLEKDFAGQLSDITYTFESSGEIAGGIW